MLAQARRLLARGQLAARVTLWQRRLPDTTGVPSNHDTVISNSLLHHLHDPQVLWHALHALSAAGAVVQVMDLLRPSTLPEVERLVAEHARAAPPVLRRDFANSLCAAFTADEIRAQLAATGLALQVEVVSDRHVLVSGRL
jgi:hypothetical protein